MGVFAGGVLIGISVGIKLYNMVFGLFIVIYEMWTDIEFKNLIIRIKLDSILKKGLTILFGCIIGFIATNSIVIWDTKAYLANMVNSKGLFSLTRMWHLLIDTGIQWDLVNSGGFCHSIVSLFGIICFFLIGCINRKKRRMVAATLLSFIVVTLLFTSTSVVLGWYYLPFLFILPLCMPDKIVYAIMLIVNFHFIGADTCYQIETKFQQIENVQNQIEIAKYIDEIYKGYNEYVRWNFIDVGLGEIATTKFEWNKFCSIQQDIDKEKIFMAVSERYRNNALINSFVIKAESNIDGYKLLEQQEEIYIIIHSPN